MANVDEYQIRELAKDEHCWRIDWFGAVTYAKRYRRASQPLIEIQLSQVPDDLRDVSDLFVLKNDQWPKTRQINLPVGLLPLFKIGDIWRDGRLINSPDYDLAHFDNLWVGKNKTSLIKSGLPEDDGGAFYLPIAQHPYHIHHTQSYCVLVKSDSCNIVLPASELIRFYFGSSSTLVSRIFDAPFSQKKFWISTDYDSRGTPKIHLAPGISGCSASDIGRIAFSKSARAAAEIIGNSCVAATANAERAYPKAVFPFDGSTDLVASGKWLTFDGNEHGVFLVFKLISCTHPFPFASLRYTSERNGPLSAKSQFSNASGCQRGEQEKRFSKARQETKVIVDEEPDRARKPRDIGFFVGEIKFPDLARKQVSKVEPDQVPTILLSQNGVSILSGSSVGDGGCDAKVQPIELAGTSGGNIALTGNSAAANALTTTVFLNLTTKLLESGRFISIDIIRLDPRQRFDYLSMMPQIIDNDGEVSSVCLIVSSENDAGAKMTTRNRRISIGRAQGTSSIIFFLVPESQQAMDHFEQEVELHLIIDTSNAITTNADLLAAIAVHFSRPVQFEKPVELIVGVTAMVFKVAYLSNELSHDQTEIISSRLYQNAGPFFAATHTTDKDSVAVVEQQV